MQTNIHLTEKINYCMVDKKKQTSIFHERLQKRVPNPEQFGNTSQTLTTKYRSKLLNIRSNEKNLISSDDLVVTKKPSIETEHRLNQQRKLAIDFVKCTNVDSSNVLDNSFLICKENRIENATRFYGCYYLGPLAPGQGLTFGNMLRRTLLASLPGLAFTAVEIEGITHEYASLPGIKETILDILLAINEIILISSQLKVHKPLLAYLKKSGPGKVYARDLRLPPGIKCVDPNHYICTLSDSGSLNMKLQIQSGQGWLETKNQNWYNAQSNQTSIFNDSLVNTTDHFSSEEQVVQPWSQLQLDRSSSYMNKTNLVGEQRTIFSSNKDERSEYLAVQTSKDEDLPMGSLDSNTNPVVTDVINSSHARLPLLLNPIFNPVTKINYLVESYKDTSKSSRSSQSMDERSEFFAIQTSNDGNLEANSTFDKQELYESQTDVLPFLSSSSMSEILILEIWTNGSILPRDALLYAIRSCLTTLAKFGQNEF